MTGRTHDRRALGVVVAVVIGLTVALITVLVAAIDDGASSSAPSTSPTTVPWSKPYSYCDEHEHRVYVGPTDGATAPNIDVVPYEPSCRRENVR